MRFTVKVEHIRLLRKAYVRWEDGEFGAPGIDSKRPYGNSDVYGDIIEILGPEYGGYSRDILRVLHDGTNQALQIFLNTGTMEVGEYESNDYGGTWHRVTT